MKKITSLLILITLCISFSYFANADSMERVRVIKFDKERHDLVIQRNDGERLLIQHNRVCNSMNIDFPIYLIWEDDKISKLKIAWNEICDVYNFGEYSDDVKITQKIKDPNFLLKDHLAEIEWDGKKYEVDYGDGCEQIKDFVDKIAYVKLSDNSLNNATLYLPGNRGQCMIKSTDFIEEVEVPETVAESPIKNIYYKAENNEAVFYWDEPQDDIPWIYLISRSRYDIDPDDYTWKQMPYLRYSAKNNYTAKYLANDIKYYFYLSARDNDGNVAPWQKLEITPVQTIKGIVNNPDFEPFEIEMTKETEENFTLTWPDKSEESRKYIIQLFVDGKRQYLKLIDAVLTEWEIPKDLAYEGAKLKFELRSLSKERFGTKYFDSIYWEWGAE